MTTNSDATTIRKTLMEFATYDAGLLLNEFLRTVLQYVYSAAGSHQADPQLHRSLVLRLLAQGVQLSDRFTCGLIADLRTPGAFVPQPTVFVSGLAQRIWSDVSPEMADLQRAVRFADRGFSIRGSFLDPIRYAHCLEVSLDEVIELSVQERWLVFNAWSGCFSSVMRRTYAKYADVVASLGECHEKTRQEFVETLPLSDEARRRMVPRHGRGWSLMAHRA